MCLGTEGGCQPVQVVAALSDAAVRSRSTRRYSVVRPQRDVAGLAVGARHRVHDQRVAARLWATDVEHGCPTASSGGRSAHRDLYHLAALDAEHPDIGVRTGAGLEEQLVHAVGVKITATEHLITDDRVALRRRDRYRRLWARCRRRPGGRRRRPGAAVRRTVSRSFEAVRLEARSQNCPAPPPHRSGSRRPRPWSPRSRWRRDLRPWPRSAARPPGQSRKHTSIPPSLRPLVGLRPIASRASNGTRRA